MAHGTVTVVAGGMNIEVTTYRHDGPYVDGRRPEYVVYLDDIVADLARRDFTVNAMAFDPATGELVDPTEAQMTLKGVSFAVWAIQHTGSVRIS